MTKCDTLLGKVWWQILLRHLYGLNDFSLGSLANFGIPLDDTGNILCHITEHTNDSTENGTYYITDIPSGNTGSVVLNATISAGSFWVEIPADAVNFNAVGRAELHRPKSMVEESDDKV